MQTGVGVEIGLGPDGAAQQLRQHKPVEFIILIARTAQADNPRFPGRSLVDIQHEIAAGRHRIVRGISDADAAERRHLRFELPIGTLKHPAHIRFIRLERFQHRCELRRAGRHHRKSGVDLPGRQLYGHLSGPGDFPGQQIPHFAAHPDEAEGENRRQQCDQRDIQLDGEAQVAKTFHGFTSRGRAGQKSS